MRVVSEEAHGDISFNNQLTLEVTQRDISFNNQPALEVTQELCNAFQTKLD